jgi:hypothetical protein
MEIKKRRNLVNFAEGCFLNGLMLDHFSQDASIAAPNDEDFLRIWMRVHSKMGDHFLVSVPFASLVSLDPLVDFP